MADSMQSYAELIHERNRADFFDTVPGYKANLNIEIARVEAAHPSWVGSPAVQALINAHHQTHKYGRKAGSPNKEV